MPREVKIHLPEFAGDRDFLVIYSAEGGIWEPEWEPLRGTEVGRQVPSVTKEAFEWALEGYTPPFVKQLGVPPEGALLKIPGASRVCRKRKKCSLYDRVQCHVGGKNMPWCFEPDGIANESEVFATAKIIEYWRAGVYVVVQVENV